MPTRKLLTEISNIGDGNGDVTSVTPEGVNALLDHSPAYDAIDRLYVGPALEREREKNG